MLIQLTDAGAALLDAQAGPITLSTFKLGSASGYIPSPSDTDIHGTLIYTGGISPYVVIDANVVKYSCYLDYDLGPFQFGELGLFTDTGVLFALAANDVLIDKKGDTGNSIRLDSYLSMVQQNYQMWLDYASTSNKFAMAILGSVDQLPPPQNAVPNAYIISGRTAQQSAFIAYTDRNGLWNFDAYQYANQAQLTIIAFDSQSVTIDISEYQTGMNPTYIGEIAVEFSTGALYGICRYVSTVVVNGSSVTFGFENALMQTPTVGDKFVIFGRQALSTTLTNIPIASTTELGGIIVGDTLTITTTGVLDVNPTGINYPVTSVNGQTGTVTINANNLPGLAQVAKTNDYNDLSNKPGIASTTALGLVKVPNPTKNTIVIDGTGVIDLGFAPVKTVNNQGPDANGNINLTSTTTGLVGATQIPNGSDLNTYTKTGLFYALAVDVNSINNIPAANIGQFTLEVVPFYVGAGPGDVIQRVMTSSQVFFRAYITSVWYPWTSLPTTMQFSEETILATAIAQNTFTTSNPYTPGGIEVYLAGVRLQPGIDYTATDGTTVVLQTTVANQVQIGATLTISKFNTFNIANTLTASQLAGPNGATLVGFGSSTVGTVLTNLQGGQSSGNFTSLAITGINHQVPITGFTLTLTDDGITILDPAGTLAAGTITLYGSPRTGQQVTIVSTQNITSLTVNPNSGQTVSNAPTSLIAGNSISFIYYSNNWYKI